MAEYASYCSGSARLGSARLEFASLLRYTVAEWQKDEVPPRKEWPSGQVGRDGKGGRKARVPTRLTAKIPPTITHAGIGTTKKRRKVVFGKRAA
jgi:hypothetical protein